MLQKRVCRYRTPVLAGTIICLLAAVDFCDGAEKNAWSRHKIDDLPARAMFIQAGDLDNDGRKDLIAGGWWWKNPGSFGVSWSRRVLGEPLRNMAAVHDFDGDGDLDVVGTEGGGAGKN